MPYGALMKSQFSLRQIFLWVGVFAVLSLVFGQAYGGHGWAVGISLALLFVVSILVLMIGSYLLLEISSQLLLSTKAPQLDDYSPFRAERPEKMPGAPEQPNLGEMIPGWDDGSPGSGTNIGSSGATGMEPPPLPPRRAPSPEQRHEPPAP